MRDFCFRAVLSYEIGIYQIRNNSLESKQNTMSYITAGGSSGNCKPKALYSTVFNKLFQIPKTLPYVNNLFI